MKSLEARVVKLEKQRGDLGNLRHLSDEELNRMLGMPDDMMAEEENAVCLRWEVEGIEQSDFDVGEYIAELRRNASKVSVADAALEAKNGGKP
ncbi:MAG: hypothetical protein QM661_09710 [Solimonas sp.]